MIKFENVIKSTVDDNTKYLCYVNGAELLRMLFLKQLRYNKEIQRGIVLKKVRGEIKEDPIVVKNKISKISDDMIHGDFYESTLVFNISSKECKVQEEGNSLMIDSWVDILDGWHRISALKLIDEKAKEEKHLYRGKFAKEYVFPVEITMLDENQAKNKFYQLTLGAKISTSRAEYLNYKDATNNIIRHLMQKGNELYQMVEESKNIIPKKSLKKIVTFATLVTAINANINVEVMNREEITSFSNFLNMFFGELLVLWEGFLYEDTRKEESEMYMQYDNFMFHGYIALAVELWGTYSEVKTGEYGNAIADMQLLKEINFKKDDPLWESVVSKRETIKRGTVYTAINNVSTRKAVSTILVREFKILKQLKNKNE